MEEMKIIKNDKLDYTIDNQHNNIVFCNYCKKRFNILNIEGHIKRELEKLKESKNEGNNLNFTNDVDSHIHVKKYD